MLQSKIYAATVSNLTDARYFAAWDVSWMSFDLNPDADSFLSPAQVLAIKEWVEGPQIVGAFELQSAEEIQQVAQDLELDAIQIGMFTELETLLALETTLPIIKTIIVQEEHSPTDVQELIGEFAAKAQFFLLDFDKIGWNLEKLEADQRFDLEWLKALCEQYPIILNLDIKAAALLDFIDQIPIQAYMVKGGAEEKVGFKSFEELDEIFEAIEE